MPQPLANFPASSASGDTPLAQALRQNETVQDTVEQSASELLVINAVLKQEIPAHVKTGDVAQALQKTDELEARINDSVADLAQVNEALAHEVDARAELEQELAMTKAALTRAESRAAG